MITVSTLDIITCLIVALSMGFVSAYLFEDWKEFNREYNNGK